MLIVLDCPGCAKRYEVDASLAGKKSRCKQCGEVFQIPVPRAASPPPNASRPFRPPQNVSGGPEWQTALVQRQPTARTGRDNAAARPSSNSAGPGATTIVLNCPNCQKRYEIDEVLAGKKSRCKDCGEVFSIPVPRGLNTDASRSRGAQAARPADRWDEVLDDEPASFKASRGAGPSAFDDIDDLPPPPRAGYSEPHRKTSRSYSHRGGGTDAGLAVAGCYLGLLFLIVVGFFIWMGAAGPTIPEIRVTFRTTSILLNGIAGLLFLCGWIWILIIAFTESLAQGLLVLLVPCYSLFFVFTRWEETKGAFVLKLLMIANGFAYGAMGAAIGYAGKTEALTGVPDGGGAQPGGVPVAGDPQPGIPQPGVAPQPGFPPQPNFPRPGFPQPGPGPQPGPRGFGPGNRGFAPRPGQGGPIPPINVEIDPQAVFLVISGVPTNRDPSQGLTAREVMQAIAIRARQLAPTAVAHAWVRRGNRSALGLAPVDDIQGFANRIDFGTVSVSGNLIYVTLSPNFATSVPRLPAEPPQTPDINPGPRAGNREPEIPADADAVAKSLIQLKADATHTKKDGLNRLMRTRPDERLAEVVHAVLPLLEDDDGWLVGDAIKVLVIWNSPEVVPAIINRTNDNRFGVRHEAIKALGKIKDPRGVEPVVQRLQEDGPPASDALKEMGPIAESALIDRLTNPDPGIRRRVCDILKDIGGKETLKAMQALPADPDLGVRMAAKNAASNIILRVGPLSASERKSAKGRAGSSPGGGSRR
jgi:HEAT repeats